METCTPSSLNYVFIQACKAHRARTAALLAELDVHVGQEMILVALWQQDGVPMTQLAERLEVQPPTVSRMVQRMESTGLVERRTSEADQRVAFVHVTEKGREIRREIEEVWSTIEQQMTEGMSEGDSAHLYGMLALMRTNLGGSG